MNRKINGISLLKLICSIVFFIGFLTFLKPCGPKEDGTFMHCHDAGTALMIIAAVMIVLSVVSLLTQAKALTLCCNILMIAGGIVSILIPGHIISLCMMPDMRCRAITQPGGVIFGVILLILAVLSLIADRKKGDQKGKRKAL